LLNQAGSLGDDELSNIPEAQLRLRAHETDPVLVDLTLPAVDRIGASRVSRPWP
jgi:hypothetical protein